MRIGPVVAAPALLRVGGEPVLISPPSLRDLGLLLRFLEDAVEPPAGARPDWRPGFGDPGAVEALTEPVIGRALLLYVGMRRDQPETRLVRAVELAPLVHEDDIALLVEVVLCRRRPGDDQDLSHWFGAGRDSGQPIHEVDLGRLVESPAVRGFAPDVVAGWTLDQLENKLLGGERDPATCGHPMTGDQFAAWLVRMADPAERARVAAARAAEVN